MPKVKTEQIGQCKPATHGKDGARQCGEETLLSIRSKEVQSFHGENCEPDRNGPMNVRPQQNKQIGEVDATGEPFSESGPDNHHGQCYEHQGSSQER